MKELLKNLGIELSKIEDVDELSKEFKCIAEKLFTEYEIICGDKHFHFAEIEFYYYRKGRFDKEWNSITYDRNKKEDGDFMYHNSGVDICFKSQFSKDNAEFGGILIRSLYTLNKNREKKLFLGPLVCKDEMLNCCKSYMPKLCKSDINTECDVKCTSLAGVPKEKQSNHCFYDSSISKEKWVREVERYDVKKQNVWTYKARYNTNRFELKSSDKKG